MSGPNLCPKPLATKPLTYLSVLPRIVETARGLGYCIAVHGSLNRDLDLVAIPWIIQAVPAQELVDALVKITSGFFLKKDNDDGNPTQRWHGRKAWSIYLTDSMYIDLSVMPRLKSTDCSDCGGMGWKKREGSEVMDKCKVCGGVGFTYPQAL